MPVNEPEFTTVIPSRGRRVHAISLTEPTRTACGRSFNGWRIAIRRLNCGHCKRAILARGTER